jgi:glyoxylase-like metal-dependent hydrolase (beta-lactamase superfamily II)
MPAMRIGNVEVLPMLDAILPNPLDEALPTLSPAERAVAARDLNVVDGMLLLPVTCYLVRSAGRSILVDTGIGRRPRGVWPPGALAERMADAGVRPDDVDIVVNTHMHVDHVGWNTVDDERGPRPWFRSAHYLVQQDEWSHWQPVLAMGSAPAHLVECVAPLFDLASVALVSADAAITPEVSFTPLPGHTPGHVGVRIDSVGERAVIIGDASHHLAQLAHPEWSPTWDADPTAAARTRARLFDDVESSGALVAAGHWPGDGIGRIVRLNDRRVFAVL